MRRRRSASRPLDDIHVANAPAWTVEYRTKADALSERLRKAGHHNVRVMPTTG